jgi:hypothetical protein
MPTRPAFPKSIVAVILLLGDDFPLFGPGKAMRRPAATAGRIQFEGHYAPEVLRKTRGYTSEICLFGVGRLAAHRELMASKISRRAG